MAASLKSRSYLSLPTRWSKTRRPTCCRAQVLTIPQIPRAGESQLRPWELLATMRSFASYGLAYRAGLFQPVCFSRCKTYTTGLAPALGGCLGFPTLAPECTTRELGKKPGCWLPITPRSTSVAPGERPWAAFEVGFPDPRPIFSWMPRGVRGAEAETAVQEQARRRRAGPHAPEAHPAAPARRRQHSAAAAAAQGAGPRVARISDPAPPRLQVQPPGPPGRCAGMISRARSAPGGGGAGAGASPTSG